MFASACSSTVSSGRGWTIHTGATASFWTIRPTWSASAPVRRARSDVSQGAEVPDEALVAETVDAAADAEPLRAYDDRVQRLLEPVSQSAELQRAARLLASARGAV